MRIVFCTAFIFWALVSVAQVGLSGITASNRATSYSLEYFVYSTHGGNGATTDYPTIISNKTDFDKLFNTSFPSTRLHTVGKTNSMLPLDWSLYTKLTGSGIAIPNNGDYFSFMVRGLFTPLETGNYTFCLNADDACDFTFDGSVVISYYGVHGIAVNPISNSNTNIATVSLVAGKSYPFMVRMQECGGEEGLQLYWKNTSTTGTESGGFKKIFTQHAAEVAIDKLLDGSSAAYAAPSAEYIKNKTGANTDGVYWINLPNVGPTQIYCIMNSAVDGGGWMMMMKATRGTTFQYSSSHWTSVTTLNPTDLTRNDADAKYHTMNYFAGRDLLALWPDINTVGGSLSLPTYNCWTWQQKNFNNGIRITPINFWANVNRLFFSDANNFAGKGSIFSSQPDVRFYGFNFVNDGGTGLASRTRWGFGWNENGGGLYPNGNMLSDDVTGGIGVTSDRVGSYSAGDYVACCQNATGINRTARVEVYIR